MKSGTVTTMMLALALVACGDETPPPKLSKPAPPPSPAAGPQAKAPLTPKLAEPVPAPVPAQPSADQALADRVKAALRAERGVNAERIDITAKDGTVTLFGTAETGMQREIALKVTAAVAGVKSVENKLQVVAGS